MILKRWVNNYYYDDEKNNFGLKLVVVPSKL